MPVATIVWTSTRPTSPRARSTVEATSATGALADMTTTTTGTCSGQPVSPDNAHAANPTAAVTKAAQPAHCRRARSRAVARRQLRTITTAATAASTRPSTTSGAAGTAGASAARANPAPTAAR